MDWFEEAEERLAKWKQAGKEYWGKFTPRALRVVSSARSEAEQLKQNCVGTEHLLLGLLALGNGVAFNILTNLGLSLETVRAEISKGSGSIPAENPLGYIPPTPRCKRVLEMAKKEAIALGHTYIGTEHLLLALLAESDGPASGIFKRSGIDPQTTRREILSEISPPGSGRTGKS
jgi:ATP-dependent Clp protease ATP-binding subunit ClpC